MKLVLPRLLTYPPSPASVNNTSGNVSPTSPASQSPLPVILAPPVARTTGPRTASTFYVDFRAIFSRTDGRGHFRSALATATLTSLAGTHEFPLVAVAAGTALGELVSRRRDGRRRDSDRVALIESVPLSEDDTAELDVDDPRQRDEAKELNSGPIGSGPHTELPQFPEVDAQRDWVLVTHATGDVVGAMGASHSSLDTIRPLVSMDAPSEGQSDGITWKDYGSRPSSKPTSPPSHNSPPQGQLTLHSLSSVASFVTAQTHLSHRPSIASIRRKRYESIPRSESPLPMPQRRQSSLLSRGPPSLRISVAPHPRHSRQTMSGQRSQTLIALDEPSDLTPTAAGSTTRRLLIIGSNYKSGNRKTATMFSARTLWGVGNDTTLLWEVFEELGYDVETYDKPNYSREDVLGHIADFVSGARRGDIRAIAFIGHGYSGPDGTVMLIPPYCPTTNDAISRNAWEDNIRTHSKPGSIVFSIMAHCFSGDFMRQEHDCQTWTTQQGAARTPPSPDKSIFITFTSSTKDQFSFESTVERRVEAEAQDHFLCALARTIRDDKVCSWESFFATFKHNFDRVRSNASWAHNYDPDNTVHGEASTSLASQPTNVWRMANLQDPRFSASEVLDYSCVFGPVRA